MFTSTDIFLAICLVIALGALGAAITIGNERVRRATLQVRDVARHYALADLAMRREQARAAFTFATPADGLRTLNQIALDVTGERHELVQMSVVAGAIPAITARGRDESEFIFTPSADAYLNASPDKRRRVQQLCSIDGLVSGPFVVEELSALAQHLGLSALPRTEQWSLIVLSQPRFEYPRVVRRLSGFLSRR